MKKNIAYLAAAIIWGTIVYAIMHWVFRFPSDESFTFGLIAAIVEPVITLGNHFFSKRKKQGSA